MISQADEGSVSRSPGSPAQLAAAAQGEVCCPAEPRLRLGGDLSASCNGKEQQVSGARSAPERLMRPSHLGPLAHTTRCLVFHKPGDSVQILRGRNEGSEGRHVPLGEAEAVQGCLESKIRV